MIQGLGDPDSPGLKPFEVRLVLSLELRIKGSSAVVGPRWALQIRAALLGRKRAPGPPGAAITRPGLPLPSLLLGERSSATPRELP